MPPRGEWNASGVVLVAVAKRAPGLSWARPTGFMFGGLAALLAIGFVVGVARRPRS